MAIQKPAAEATATAAPDPDQDAVGKQVHLYRSAVQIGIAQTAARTSAVMKKHNALARRPRDRQDDYLRFTTDKRIPPDNNGSERDIRMMHLSTAAKHGKHFFEVLVMLTEGHPWQPAIH